MHIHLPKQRDVTVECEMRQRRHQKILPENEILDGTALVGGVVNDDIGKNGNARQCVRHGFRIVRLEIEKIPVMAYEGKAERGEITGVVAGSRDSAENSGSSSGPR